MLQQTRVDTVVPYFRRFMRAFPSLRALAEAELESVLKAWEGLGYYSRARNLHKAARIVVKDNGRLPRTATALASLPGVGSYTAAAIASIAFSEPVPAVDGNVLRVFARVWTLEEDIRRPAVRAAISRRLAPAIAGCNPGEFNQATMELGALVCLPRRPRCASCPLKRSCVALRTGRVEELPVRSSRGTVPHYDIGVALIRKRGKVLIARRREDQMLGGLWEFPGGKQKRGESLQETTRREIAEELGIRIDVGAGFCTVKHAYSHFKVTLHVFECRHRSGRARPLECDAVKWVTAEELADYPFPASDRRIIALLRQGGAG
jgi:A/G-specific adenine glycosylase